MGTFIHIDLLVSAEHKGKTITQKKRGKKEKKHMNTHTHTHTHKER